jgi:hypothetical protein
MGRKKTRRQIVACGYFLAECLKIGWRKDQLDVLERLWWKYAPEATGERR